jgi:hypothetical protein
MDDPRAALAFRLEGKEVTWITASFVEDGSQHILL